MNWDSRIETAEADYAQAKKDLADGRGDIELVKGCLAYLTSLVNSRDHELARTAPAGRNDVNKNDIF